MKINKKIGLLIREYREKQNLTQLQVANKLGYDSMQFVSLFERGISRVPLTAMGKLTVILKIPENILTQILIDDFKADMKAQIEIGKASLT